MRNLLIISSVALALASCATTPPSSERLDRAHAEVNTLAQDPLTQQVAAQDLEAARQRLQQADTALQDRRPAEDVDHLAYLAERDAQAGEARIEGARARQQVAQADEERNRVLLEARAREADNAKAQLAATQAQLAELKAKQTDRGLVVTLGDVLFDTGRATLKPGADLTLDRLATVLKNDPQSKVLIQGFTDSRGSADYNDELSQRRADAVASALVRRGVPADSVHAEGRGKEFPVATNDTPEGRQQNRRVEIVFTNGPGRLAQSANEGNSGSERR
jgi:OmpA-OmpF porin, OOP family